METEHHVVTAADWRKNGYQDGRHGNPSWPPSGPGSAESRRAYIEGFKSGRLELSTLRKQRGA